MSRTGDDALRGIKEHISGQHTLTIEKESTVIACGMMVKVYRSGETVAAWVGTDTGEEGQFVTAGDQVETYNVDIQVVER